MGKTAWAIAPVLGMGTIVAGACTSFGGDESPSGTDSGTVAEAGADVEAATEASLEGGTSYCASLSPAPAHCDDFDDATPYVRWPTKTETSGKLSVVPGGVSTPSALRAFIAAGAASPSKVMLSRRLTGNIANFVFEADVSIKTLAADVSGSHVQLVGLRALDMNGTLLTAVSFIRTPSGMKLYVDQKSPSSDTSTADLTDLPNTKPWTRVRIESKNGELRVSYDGEPQLDTPDLDVTSALVEVEVGVGSAAVQASQQDVSFDNVVARFGP